MKEAAIYVTEIKLSVEAAHKAFAISYLPAKVNKPRLCDCGCYHVVPKITFNS